MLAREYQTTIKEFAFRFFFLAIYLKLILSLQKVLEKTQFNPPFRCFVVSLLIFYKHRLNSR